MEDIFITRLYSSGVLRYAENDSDIDFAMRWKITAKGPNALGNKNGRRIPIRQRTLHPSMLGILDCSEGSSSDPNFQENRKFSYKNIHDIITVYYNIMNTSIGVVKIV